MTGSASPSRPADDGGHALPVVLLALAALSLLAAAALVGARSERRISGSHRAAFEALEAARSGLAEYLAGRTDFAAGATYVRGRTTAEVLPRRLLGAAGSLRSVHLVTSRGLRVAGADTVARTVARVVARRVPGPDPDAAVTAASGLRAEGGAVVDGADACGASPGAAGGAAVPAGGFAGDSSSLAGDPPLVRAGTGRDLLRAAGVDSADWEALGGGPVPPGVRSVPGDGWPASFAGWPVVRLEDAAATLGTGHGGRGTIVAAGDLFLEGAFDWRGLLLVGGALAASDGARVRGAAIAGLNRHLGDAPGLSTVGGGTELRYDACAAEEAAGRLPARVSAVPGSWFERR